MQQLYLHVLHASHLLPSLLALPGRLLGGEHNLFTANGARPPADAEGDGVSWRQLSARCGQLEERPRCRSRLGECQVDLGADDPVCALGGHDGAIKGQSAHNSLVAGQVQVEVDRLRVELDLGCILVDTDEC